MSGQPSFGGLIRRIHGLRVENALYRKFIPESALESELTREDIAGTVTKIFPLDSVPEVTSYIVSGALRVFSILVLIHHPDLIQRFIHQDQLQTRRVDDLLPLSRDALRNILFDEQVADLFHERQWEACVPVFSDKIIPRDFAGPTILPYLNEAQIGSGTFGDVHKISIHPKHRPKGHGATTEVRIGLSSAIAQKILNLLSSCVSR